MNKLLRDRLEKYSEAKVEEEMQTSGMLSGVAPEHVIGQIGITDVKTTPQVKKDLKEKGGSDDQSVPGKRVATQKDVVNSMDTGIDLEAPQRPVQNFFAEKNALQKKRKEAQNKVDDEYDTRAEHDFLKWVSDNL